LASLNANDRYFTADKEFKARISALFRHLKNIINAGATSALEAENGCRAELDWFCAALTRQRLTKDQTEFILKSIIFAFASLMLERNDELSRRLAHLIGVFLPALPAVSMRGFWVSSHCQWAMQDVDPAKVVAAVLDCVTKQKKYVIDHLT
jgi:hypothetical protein